MSLLNLTSDGLPNVLIVLCQAVLGSKNPLSRDELLAAVAPDPPVMEGGRMARQTLTRWTELGLFAEEDGKIILAVSPGDSADSEAGLLRFVRRAAREKAFDESNSADLWSVTGSRASDLTRSIAWLMCHDVYKTQFSRLEDLEAAQLPDGAERLLKNSTRRTGLQVWGKFLGFVRQGGGGDIDPTVAVRDVLPEIIQPGEEMPVTRFIERLADVLPVLEGGKWRLQIESRLKPGSFLPRAQGQISTALSRAMLQLWRGGEIVLENKADVGSGIGLTGRDGPINAMRFTWVRRPSEGLAG